MLLTVILTSVWTANAIRRGRPAGRRAAIVLGLYGTTMLVWRGRQMGEVAATGHLPAPVVMSFLIAGSGWLALVVAMAAVVVNSRSEA